MGLIERTAQWKSWSIVAVVGCWGVGLGCGGKEEGMSGNKRGDGWDRKGGGHNSGRWEWWKKEGTLGVLGVAYDL
jgi:hypothetical protein